MSSGPVIRIVLGIIVLCTLVLKIVGTSSIFSLFIVASRKYFVCKY